MRDDERMSGRRRSRGKRHTRITKWRAEGTEAEDDDLPTTGPAEPTDEAAAASAAATSVSVAASPPAAVVVSANEASAIVAAVLPPVLPPVLPAGVPIETMRETSDAMTRPNQLVPTASEIAATVLASVSTEEIVATSDPKTTPPRPPPAGEASPAIRPSRQAMPALAVDALVASAARSPGVSRRAYRMAIAAAVASTVIAIGSVMWARSAVEHRNPVASVRTVEPAVAGEPTTPVETPAPLVPAAAPAIAPAAAPAAPAVVAAAPVEPPPGVAAPAPVAAPAANERPAPEPPAAAPAAEPALVAVATPINDCAITVNAHPRDAKVFIDDRAVGASPVTVARPCNQAANVAIKHPRYEEFRSRVVPTSGALGVTARLQRTQTRVTITSDPQGIEVTYNGRKLGVTPVTAKVNRHEEATLWFRRRGYTADWRKIFPKTETSAVHIKMQQASAAN